MRTRVQLIALVLVVGCAHPRVIGRSALVASTFALACDGVQTMRRPASFREQNPILGEDPSSASVATYTLTAIAVNAAVYWLLPVSEDSRPAIPIAVLLVESGVIAQNTAMGASVCGM